MRGSAKTVFFYTGFTMWEQQLKNHSILIENQKNENTARFQKLFFSHDTVPLIQDKNAIAGHCSFIANLKGEKCSVGADHNYLSHCVSTW